MELCEKARKEILRLASETYDEVEKCDPVNAKEWRPVLEAALEAIVSLGCTEALQLFTIMCVSTLDFETYSEIEDVLLKKEKTVPMINTLTYQKFNSEK